VIAAHLQQLAYGGFSAAIASWAGPGTRTDRRLGELLAATARSGSPLRWAAYVEEEGRGDLATARVAARLQYIARRYGRRPAYLRVGGRPVVFVYGDPGDGCGMARRWSAGNASGVFVVLKVFQGYRRCAGTAEGWHQYAPAKAVDVVAGQSFSVSPGFAHVGEAQPRLGRDLVRFRNDVRAMVASGVPWQLVTTFNEWGEGTAVEPAAEWASADGQGRYLDALHANGDPFPADGLPGTTTPTGPTPTATPSPSGTKVVMAAGDIQPAGSTTNPTEAVLDSNPHDQLITLGDNQYSSGAFADYQASYSQTWGDAGDKPLTYPAPGNHEHRSTLSSNYCAYFNTGNNGPAALDPCANSTATPYYSFNVGAWHFASVDTGSSSGTSGDMTQAENDWLKADLAADTHLCEAVYMHHPRYSAGSHGSNAGLADNWQMMMDAGVDLVLSGHDHNYQRWAMMGANGAADPVSGIRQFVVGTGGGSHYATANRPAGLEVINTDTFGVLKLTLGASSYDWRFLPEAGKTFTDSGTQSCR
jgi:hypothetical protein